MKAVAFILFIFFYLLPVQGQTNLILNGRFEENTMTDTCWSVPIISSYFFNYRHVVQDWWNPIESSPDYYNRCDTNGESIPINTLGGFQEDPYHQNAYIGMGTFVNGLSYGEPVATHLREKLIMNKHYEFKMLVSAADFNFYYTNIGICLESDSIDFDSTSTYHPRHPDHIFMTDSVVKSCTDWTEISLKFSPHREDFRFIIVGSFPTMKPLTIYRPTLAEICVPDSSINPGWAYYLIDDVRLYCLDCDTIDSSSTTDSTPNVIACDMAFPDAFTPNGDNVNDTWKPIITAECDNTINNYLLRIFDRWDNEIFKTSDKNEGWTGAYKQSGTYIYFIQYNNQHGIQKKTGSITLIR
jgi:gliding motility-associated-like protein